MEGFHLTKLLFFITLFELARMAEICPVGNEMKWCDYGCCNNSCCNMSTIAIIGLVIGVLVMLATIIGCIVCLACMCKHAKGNRPQPMHNNTNANSVYVNNSPYGHPQPRGPPSYDSHNAYPASSNPANVSYNNRGGEYGSYNDPVYPPGNVQSGTGHPPPAYTYRDPQSKSRFEI